MSDTRVYSIGHPHGFVKIGQSVKPLERLSSLQSACPYELWLISTITPIDDDDELVRSVESGLHTYFEQCRVNREWFDVAEDEIHAFGSLREIHTSNLSNVLYEQQARTYCEDPVDPAMTPGEKGKTLVDHLKVARNRRVVP